MTRFFEDGDADAEDSDEEEEDSDGTFPNFGPFS